MIYFKKIKFKNILSTGNIFTEIQLDKSPNTLIVGINGSGKSTLLDALTFGLFGTAFRNINKPNLINSINDKDLEVEVEFRVGIKEYKVRRGIKPNFLEIYCDGVLEDQSAMVRDYQSHLEEDVLGFNYKAFTQIVLLGNSSFVPFMQLKAADRRAIIEDLLDIQIFSSMNVVVKNKLLAIKTNAIDIKRDIDSVNSQIELQKKYVEDAKNNTIDRISRLKEDRDDNTKQADKLRKDVGLIQQHIFQLIDSITDEEQIASRLRVLHELETKIDSNKNKATKELTFYSNNDNCPTCKQEIDDGFKKESVETRQSKLKEFNSALSKLEQDQNDLNVRLSDIQKVQRTVATHNSEITRITASIVQIEKYVAKLNADIEEISGKTALSQDMLDISEKLVANLEQLVAKQREIQDAKIYMDASAILLKDNGIKAKIVKQYLPVINKLVNKYLSAMDFFVNFEIDENFDEQIKSRHRDIFSYANFSEGEKTRIDLSLIFAWRAVAKLKNSMHTNLLVLDEILDGSLDNNGVEETMKLIDSFESEANIFVISHKADILADKFKEIVRFEKINNFSRIV